MAVKLLKSLDVESLFSHIQYIFRGYAGSSHMKVIGSRSTSRSQEIKHAKFSIPAMYVCFYIEDRAVTYACSMGFSDMADRMA